MEKMLEIDSIIKKALQSKTNHIEPSEETFAKILGSIDKHQARKSLNVSYKKFAVVFICAVFVIFGTTLTFSGRARASATEIIETVKTVFLINKNNKVVEKPGDYAFLKPAYSKNTHLSDADLSKKMGFKISFPQTLEKAFKLQYRAEAVGFSKSLDYQAEQELSNLTVQAIDNNDIFKDLQKYQPYRSVGAVYQNDKGVKVGAVIYNTNIPLQVENINITPTIDTKIGDQNCKWISVSYPIYPGYDMTQKPTGIASTNMLMWWKDGITYQIWPLPDNSLSMAETVKLAEAFINVQK